MAHEIEQFSDGSAAFASARIHAWHRLGEITPEPMSVDEAMVKANLAEWNVRTEPLMALVPGLQCVECGHLLGDQHDELCATGDHDGLDDSRKVDQDDTAVPTEVPDHKAVIRDNPETRSPEVLGVAGLDYTPIQNDQLAEMIKAITDQSGGFVETAGSLRGGRDVFVTTKLPEGLTVGGVDEMELYLAGMNSHDGRRALRLITTPVRVVCANTQAAALRDFRSSFTIRHTPGAHRRIQEAREALQLTWSYVAEFQAEAEKMINKTLPGKTFEKLIRQIWPKPDEDANSLVKETDDKRMEDLLGLFRTAETQENIRGTRWAGYQAITEYVDHFAPVKDTENAGAVRAERALLGQAKAVKEKAFGLMVVA
ncbi:DUF932 domain-containing protein [Saccharopolyspora hattusasensis]|uniref:DUF932 domain-containing protein n=1 Tax=Saccharopolyspora hattusasensis TaxID=1128679 RepID=UPI003D98C116